MLFLDARRRVFLALSLGDDHRHDLASSGDKIGKKPRFLVAQGRISGAVASTKWAITVASIGSSWPFAERVGEGAHSAPIDHDDRQSGAGQAGGDEGFEGLRSPPGPMARGSSERRRLDQRGQSFGVARDDETLARAANMHIQTDFSKRQCRR